MLRFVFIVLAIMIDKGFKQLCLQLVRFTYCWAGAGGSVVFKAGFHPQRDASLINSYLDYLVAGSISGLPVFPLLGTSVRPFSSLAI